MRNIRFMTGVNGQPIYSGMCKCGNVLTFSPGGRPVVCVVCGKRYDIDITATEQHTPKPKARRKAGPSERKIKSIE